MDELKKKLSDETLARVQKDAEIRIKMAENAIKAAPIVTRLHTDPGLFLWEAQAIPYTNPPPIKPSRYVLYAKAVSVLATAQ